MSADEIMLSSSSNFCIVATHIDGKEVGGKAPELLKKLQDALVCDYLDKTNIDIKSEQAVIKGDFVEGKIFPKICGMYYLKNREYVSGNYFVESCNVKINAFNMHGTIEIH